MAKEINFLTIKENGRHELIIKKSKFITELGKVANSKEADRFIAKIKQKYPKATHHTFAYRIGIKQKQEKASDNGEPSRTAGIPELKTLQLMNLTNVVVVVTRYFGGIKLGAGGLIRAYSNSVTAAIHHVGIVKAVLQQELICHLSYHQFSRLQSFLKKEKLKIDHIDYGTEVTLHFFVNREQVPNLVKNLTNILNGHLQIKRGQQKYQKEPFHPPKNKH